MCRFNLKKVESGSRFKLGKNLGLDKITVKLTWSGDDLDVQAWLLNADGLIVNDEGFVFYNSENRTEPFDRVKFGNKKNWLASTRPMSADGAVLGSKDEIDGGVETIDITLSKIDPKVQEVLVTATCYDDDLTFGQIKEAKITVIDEESGEPIFYSDLDKDYSTEDAVIAARFVVNDDGEWEYEAAGNGYSGGLQTLVDMYAEE